MTDRVRPRVLLVDDHAMFRSGVRAELGDSVEVVGEADNVESAVELICERLPGVVLLDVHLPGGGGQAVLREVRPEHPGDPLPRPVGPLGRPRRRDRGDPGWGESVRDQDHLRRRAPSCNPPGRGGRRRLLASVGRVRPRRLRPTAPNGVVPTEGLDPELDLLSPRGAEVLRLIARGYTYKEVALAQCWSSRPRPWSRTSPRCFRKLQLSTRHELTRWATDRRLGSSCGCGGDTGSGRGTGARTGSFGRNGPAVGTGRRRRSSRDAPRQACPHVPSCGQGTVGRAISVPVEPRSKQS